MNTTTLLSTLAFMVSTYFPEEMDSSLKPKDSADCVSCRNIVFDFIVVGAGSAATAGYCPYPRGHVMGGTSIGGLVYSRGRPEDYNLWEEMGNPGWNYDSILPYFLKAENMTIPELIGSPYHATGGPLNISYARYYQDYIPDFIQGGMQDYGLPKIDYNGASLYGITYSQFILTGATRCSSSRAYIEPIKYRPNLVIFKNTVVTKILFENGPQRRAIGVQCITDGEQYDVYASKEVILSAGAINTPKLLMLSGIGPSDHLTQLGIPVVVDLPGVGSNLADHAGAALLFQLKGVYTIYMDPQRTRQALIEYARDRNGVLSSPQGLITIFLNSTDDTDVHILGGSITTGVNGRMVSGVGMYAANINTKSRGTVKLASNNFTDPPLLDPKYLSVDTDIQPIIYGLRQIFNLMNTSTMQQYAAEFIQEISADCNYTEPVTDDYLKCLILENSYTGSHAVGTARMGQPSDSTTVIDPSLRVHQVKGLRVIDASAMPTIPHGNTIAAVIMIAEKACDIIKNSY